MIKQMEKLPAQNVRQYVCAYYRKSSDEQATSIEQQMEAVRKDAERKGEVIVEEFIDSGKSGSKEIEKRKDFHRMVAAAKDGKWSAIKVWDSSRFGRLDAIDGAEYKKIFRACGVHLESCTEGKIDWSTSEGRLQDAFYSEANNRFSKSLAKNIVRGKVRALSQGWWPHGRVPYGYSKQYYIGNEPVSGRLDKRGDKSTRAKGWNSKLVIEPTEAEVVRWIFETYDKQDASLRSLSCDLNSRKIPSPKHSHWSLGCVLRVLTNPIYKGMVTIGMQPRTIDPEAFERAEPQAITSQPAIVTADLWDRVNAKYSAKKSTHRRVHRPDRAGTLTGVLLCGHCGHRMFKKVKEGRVIYVCASPSLRKHLGCKQRRVHESVILPVLCAELVAAVDFKLLEMMQAAPPEQSRDELQNLEKAAADLERQIKRGQANLLQADPEDYVPMQTMLREKRAELEKVRNTILLSAAPASETDLYMRWWNEVKGSLVTVAPTVISDSPARVAAADPSACMEGYLHPAIVAEPQVLRDLLHRLNLRLTLWWRPNGVRNFTLERGLLSAEFGNSEISHFKNHIGNTPD